MKITVGECLAKYRAELGWEIKQTSIESMLEVSESQIGRIENGKVVNPGINTVIKILSAYGKTLSDLYADINSNVYPIKKPLDKASNRKRIPVIPMGDVELYLSGTETKPVNYITIEDHQSSTLFAVKMTNDRMRNDGEITYPKNSFVIFEPCKSLKNKMDILANVKGKIAFFRVGQEDDEVYYMNLNQDYPNKILDEAPSILARSIECRITCKN